MFCFLSECLYLQREVMQNVQDACVERARAVFGSAVGLQVYKSVLGRSSANKIVTYLYGEKQISHLYSVPLVCPFVV